MALRLGELVAYLSVDDDAFSSGLDEAKGSFDGFGTKLAAGAALVGAGAAAALGTSLASAIDAEAANDKLAAQLGASGQYAADLGKIAGNLYGDAYGDSLGQVNEALRGVMQSGAVMEDASNEQIQSVTAGVLNLATAFDQDLGGATTAVGQIMRTGLADNADQALDILTRGMQQGANNSQDLLDTFTEYPALFQRLGIDGQTAMGLISQGMANGARNSDLVADALKEFQIRATDGSKTSAAAFEAMGLNAQQMTAQIAAGGPTAAAGLDTVLDRLRNMEDPVARNAAAVGIFGTQAEDLGAALFALDPTTAVAGLGQVEGAAKTMGDALSDNASTDLTELKRSLENAATAVGNWLLPKLTDLKDYITDDLVPTLKDVKKWFCDNKAAIEGVAGTITLIMLPALLQLGIRALVSGGMAVAGWAMSAAGAGLAAAAYVIQSGIIMGRWVAMGIAAVVNGARIAVVWAVQIVAAAVSGAAGFAVAALRVVAGWVLMGVQSMIAAARMAAAWFIALGPIGWVTAAIIGIAILVAANWGKVKGWTTEAWGYVSGKVSGAWRTITEAVSTGVEKVSSFVGGLPQRIKGWFSGAWNWLTTAGRDLLTGLWNGISGAAGWLWGKVKSWASGLMDDVKGLFGIGSPSRVFADYGGSLMQGMANGIAGSAGTAVDAALTAAGQVGGALQVAPASARVGVNGGTGGRFGGTTAVRVYIGDRELTDIVRVETGAHVDRQLGAVADQLHYAGA